MAILMVVCMFSFLSPLIIHRAEWEKSKMKSNELIYYKYRGVNYLTCIGDLLTDGRSTQLSTSFSAADSFSQAIKLKQK